MIDVLAYLLKAAGVAFLVIAALGVLRLPDAFTRMHAATKAGTLGAGLVVLGAALSLDSALAAATAAVTVFILLLTVPLASHCLGRAAYISGAPFWRGTEADALAGTLPRGDGPSVDAGPITGPFSVERVVVAPTFDSDCAAATQAIALARRLDAPLVCVGIIDPRFFETSADGMRLARVRVQTMLMRAAALGADDAPVEVVEDDPRSALGRLVQPGDLVVLPSRGWFDHGVGCEPEDMSGRGEALLPLARGLGHPVLLVGEAQSVSRITVVDDGSEAVPAALALLATREPFGPAQVVVSWSRDVEPTPERRAELTSACAGVSFTSARGADSMLSDPGEVVVATSPYRGRADWYGLDWHDRIAPGWRGHLLLV